MTDCGDPPRLVPHELIPAARLIHRELDYGGGREPFEQGRGPLCWGGAEYQEDELSRLAQHYANLARALEDLAYWMADQAEAVR
jgi:hypothetical protein